VRSTTKRNSLVWRSDDGLVRCCYSLRHFIELQAQRKSIQKQMAGQIGTSEDRLSLGKQGILTAGSTRIPQLNVSHE